MVDKIVINISAAEGKVFEAAEVIHAKERDMVLGSITKILGENGRNIAQYDGNEDMPPYNAVFVSGVRGAGKTSFLHSIERTLKSNDPPYRDLYVLPFLDPTLIENKAHIFLTIISLIKSCADSEIDGNRNDNESTRCRKRCNLDEKLERLSCGLPALSDKVSSPKFWDDASLILQKGLNDMSAAFQLRKRFIDFLHEALKVLDKKAFVLLVDDVDTNFDKTRPMLETMRKYLATKNMIVIMAGDFELISAAVRGAQWENFGKTLLQQECGAYNVNSESASEGIIKYTRYVSGLESQYLQKIFRPELRVKLRSLMEVSEESTVIVSNGRDSDGKTLKAVYDDAFKMLGMASSRERGAYKEFCMGLALRTQIGMIKAMQKLLDEKGTAQKSDMDGFARDAVNLFMTYLVRKEIDTNKILESGTLLTIEMLNFLHSYHILDEYYQMEPISMDDITNGCITTLSVVFSDMTAKKPMLSLDFALRIPYMRNLQEAMKAKGSTSNMDELIEYTGVLTGRDTRQMICYATAYMCGALLKVNRSGIVSLKSLYRVRGRHKENKDALDFILDYKDKADDGAENIEITRAQRCIAYLPFSVCASNDGSPAEYVYCVFTLLASIIDFVRDASLDEGMQKDSYAKILERMAQVKTYLKRQSIGSVAANEDDEEEESEEDKNAEEKTVSNADEGWQVFGRMADKWKDYIKTLNVPIPTYIVAKIITRCYYAFLDIQKAYKGNTLGELMRLEVCEIFHAAIVEEYNETFHGRIEVRNILTDTRYLANDLGTKNTGYPKDAKAKTVHELLCVKGGTDFAMTRMLITCPLLVAFLKKDDLLNSIVQISKALLDTAGDTASTSGTNDFDSFYDGTIYKRLSLVSLAEKTSDKKKLSDSLVDITTDATSLIIIKQNIGYDTLMNGDEKEVTKQVAELFRPYSTKRITVRTIRKLRRVLKEDEITW